MPLIFVYGSLKQGFPNFSANHGERLAGIFASVVCYPLYLVGSRYSPWLVDNPGAGYRVSGEIYRVDQIALEKMDQLERIDDVNGYRRKVKMLRDEITTEQFKAFVYLKSKAALARATVRLGPLSCYTHEHATCYKSRSCE